MLFQILEFPCQASVTMENFPFKQPTLLSQIYFKYSVTRTNFSIQNPRESSKAWNFILRNGNWKVLIYSTCWVSWELSIKYSFQFLISLFEFSLFEIEQSFEIELKNRTIWFEGFHSYTKDSLIYFKGKWRDISGTFIGFHIIKISFCILVWSFKCFFG